SRIPGKGFDYKAGNKADANSIYTWGTCGHGFVIRNLLNTVTNNRVESIESGGFASGYNIFLRDIPKTSKALPMSPGKMGKTEYDVRRLGSTFNGKTYKFDGNTVFGCTPVGMTLWDTGGGGRRYVLSGTVGSTIITNFTAAHVYSVGVRLYES